MSKLVYYLFYALSLLPFGMLYALSDCFYVLVYHVARYRRSIVHENLSTAFPEKTSEEILKIEHEFFHWLCDYFVEAIKLLSISEKELRRHFTITNSEEIEACFRSGQNVAAILGHYCNWEWLSTVGIDLPKERKMGLIYKPLSSDIFDYLFIRLRSHLGGVPVPKNDILRYLVKYRKDGIMNFFGYISDQAPKWEDIHLWLPFLNHDTPVFTGAERIMRKMNNAVYYVEMSRPKRGQYVCTYHLITKSPSSLPDTLHTPPSCPSKQYRIPHSTPVLSAASLCQADQTLLLPPYAA